MRAAAIVIIFAVPAEADAVQWRLVVLSDIPGLIYCSIFVLFCTSAMAHMFEVCGKPRARGAAALSPVQYCTRAAPSRSAPLRLPT